MLLAAQRDSLLPITQELIAAGATPNVRFEMNKKADRGDKMLAWYPADGSTALHCAAKLGAIKTLKFLLEKGGDPNARDKRRWRTPLHYICIDTYVFASSQGAMDHLKALLLHGGMPNQIDLEGNTPLMYLCSSFGFWQPHNLQWATKIIEQRKQLIDLLLSAGAFTRITNYFSGLTATQIARSYNDDIASSLADYIKPWHKRLKQPLFILLRKRNKSPKSPFMRLPREIVEIIIDKSIN